MPPRDAKPLDLPSAPEAEMALLGAMLCDNTAFSKIPPALGPEHFGEPFHARLFRKMQSALERGQSIDGVVLSSSFAGDPAFEELGGFSYLGLLMANAPPADNAGAWAQEILAMSVRRGLVQMGQEMGERARDPAESPLELLADAGKMLGEMHATDSSIRLIEADEALDSVLDYIDNPAGHASGVLPGLAPLDEALGPWLPDDLLVLGGRPGMGKSAVSAVISQNVAKRPVFENGVLVQEGEGVIEIHAEMSVEQVWRRRLTATAHSLYASGAPAYAQIRKRTVTFDQREMIGKARETLRGLPLKAVKRSGITLGRLRALVIRQRAEWARQGIRLVLVTIDHVGLIKTDREYQSRVDQQTEVSGGLKQLAGDLKVPVLALAQLSRKVEERDDKRPTLPDLRDSGSWEQDADVVMFAYRDAYYATREREPKDTTDKERVVWAEWDQRKRSPWIEIGLAKVREGDTTTIKLWAHMPTNTILGAAPQDDFFGSN